MESEIYGGNMGSSGSYLVLYRVLCAKKGKTSSQISEKFHMVRGILSQL